MAAVLKCNKLRELRVLIVDDNPGDRVLYKQLLEESGRATDYVFFEADSGRSAFALMETEKLDCVLLDYLLPDMVGVDILKSLDKKAGGMAIPIIMLTGFGDEDTAVCALQNGAHGYLPKRDLDGDKLHQAIDQVIKAHGSELLLEKSRQEMVSNNRDLESKYKQVETLYKQVLGKLQKPVSALREHIAELTTIECRPAGGNLQSHLLNLRLEIERLATTLKNLMDKPDLDVGKLLISTRPESIVELVTATVNTFRPLAEANNVRLSVRLQPGLTQVPMDRYRIEQVLVNLLDNAIKFTPPQGRVQLNVEQSMESPGEISVSVIDTGNGIAAHRLETLFDSKPHLLPDGAEAAEGLGLGLRMCKEIIRSHQGQISARSSPESGTCMSFTLPLDERKKPSAEIWQHVTKSSAPVQWRLEA